MMEKRREEFEVKIDQIYQAFTEADDKMIEELKISRDLALKQHEDQNGSLWTLSSPGNTARFVILFGCKAGVRFIVIYVGP